jgi:hypothetical protein
MNEYFKLGEKAVHITYLANISLSSFIMGIKMSFYFEKETLKYYTARETCIGY